MNRVETDFSRNFIRVKLDSIVGLNEAVGVAQEVFLQIEMFKGQCFSVLLDIRDAEPFAIDVARVWADVAKTARSLGLIKSARLVRAGSMQDFMRQIARDAGNDDLVRDFTEESAAVNWLTTASSRRLT